MTYAPAISPTWLTLTASRLMPRLFSQAESSGLREGTGSRAATPPVSTRQPARWLISALERLDFLASLGPGWDEVAAQPISLDLITAAANFLASDPVSELKVQPDIVPTFEGGLLIEWHTEAVDFIIESSPSAGPSFYFLDHETGEEVEAPLGEHLEAVATAFTKLASR